MNEDLKVLSIGSVEGGWSPKMSTWREAIASLTRQIAEDRIGVQSPLRVNVVFHVPGDILKPEFEGVRTGVFSKKKSLLAVQVALPVEPTRNVDEYLRARAIDALEEAEKWAKKKKIVGDLSHLRAIILRSGPE